MALWDLQARVFRVQGAQDLCNHAVSMDKGALVISMFMIRFD